MQEEPPAQFPKEPLRPPSLRWLILDGDSWWRLILRPVLLSIRLAMLAIWWSGYGLARGLQTGWRLLVGAGHLIRKHDYWVNWAFRLIAALSVGYLLYDRLYETGAVISVSASDPHDPTFYPFTITNQSHLFKLRNVAWECELKWLDVDNKRHMENVGLFQRSHMTIFEGQTVNFDCFKSGNISFFGSGKNVNFTDIEMAIHVKYSVALRSRESTMRFRWMGKASNPQWIRGDSAD
jgi:hypothetical protein